MNDYRELVERLRTENETLTAQLTASEAARADLGKRLAAVQQELAQVKTERSWISVKDRLPGWYETVLIAIATINGYGDPAQLVTIGGYDHSEKRWEQYTSTDRQLCRGETVNHWMPLPEPPEDAETEMKGDNGNA